MLRAGVGAFSDAQTDRSLNEGNITGGLKNFRRPRLCQTRPCGSSSVSAHCVDQDSGGAGCSRNRAQQLREAAYLWANRLASAARIGPEEVQRMIGLLEGEPIATQPYFITSLAEQLQDEEGALAPMRAWIQEHFKTPLN